MATQVLNLYCHKCQAETGHTKSTVNHVLHALLSLLTAGLWLIVWFLIVLSQTAPVCSQCRNFHNPKLAMATRTRLQQASTKRCPACAEEVRVEAIKCKHCGSNLDVTSASPRQHARPGTPRLT